MAKKRLDIVLTERGLVKSRTDAQCQIMSGRVRSDTKIMDKVGELIPEDLPLHIEQPEHQWVSRGGLKLVHAIEQFRLDVREKIVADIGASTGGFTDVLLTKGAAKVYAVDVGHGQLDWKLRNDPRVVVMEKTNARYVTAEHIPDPLDMVVCDASFIGLKTVLPAALALCKSTAIAAVLIKPQFEVGPENVGKGGVVRDPALHQQVCDDIKNWFVDLGWNVLGISQSPIQGPKGNIEFLCVAVRE